MRVIIMGCGRVGEQVSRLLADEGHAVTVIDYDLAALERLGPTFPKWSRACLTRAALKSTNGWDW